MTNIAHHVLSFFGGAKPYSELSKTPLTTVRSWEESGLIPTKQQAAVLALGKDKGLTPADFFPKEKQNGAEITN